MKIIKRIVSALILTIALSLNLTAIDDVRLLRFPDINNNLVTFVYAGDIWTVNSEGGEARRLTKRGCAAAADLVQFRGSYATQGWLGSRNSRLDTRQ